MKQQSELSKMSDSVTKTIVENVNNVLGILPKTLSFEVSMPKKKVHHRKVKAQVRHKKPTVAAKANTVAKRAVKKAKKAGVQLKKRAKTAVTKARKAAPRKMAAKKAVKRPRSRTVVALKLKRKPARARAA